MLALARLQALDQQAPTQRAPATIPGVLTVGGVAYLVAIPAFFAVLLPAVSRGRRGAAGLPLTLRTP